MLYTDSEVWVDKIDILDTTEKVLGGTGGPTNRPTKELANRTAWLRKMLFPFLNTPKTALNLRIPVFSDVTLNVTTGGNDATGSLTTPFRQPQAALDYASSRLDFQVPAILKIDIQNGQYDAIDIRTVPQNILILKIKGQNSDNTLVKYVVSHAPCEVEICDIGINGCATNLNNAMVIVYTGATIIVTGNVSFFPQTNCCPVIAHQCGHVYVQNSNVILRPGAVYYAIFTASGGGCVRVGSSSIMVDVGVSVSNALVYATLAGIFIAENMLMSNIVTGKRYTADSAGSILSNSTANTWPCSLAGTNDGTAIIV